MLVQNKHIVKTDKELHLSIAILKNVNTGEKTVEITVDNDTRIETNDVQKIVNRYNDIVDSRGSTRFVTVTQVLHLWGQL